MLPLSQVSGLLRQELYDLRDQVVRLHPLLYQNVPPTAAAALGEAVVARAAAPQLSRSILWVDDDPTDNILCVDDLKQRKFQVETALSTQEALNKLKTGSYDVIVSDMVRKEGSVENTHAGLDLLNAVRQRNPKIPFIIMSDPQSVNAVKALDIQDPAVVVTASPTELIAALQHFPFKFSLKIN